MAWSIVCLLTFLANDFGSMLACRFMLGVTEAPVSTPAMINKAKASWLTRNYYSSTQVPSSFCHCSTPRKKLRLEWPYSTLVT